MSETPNTVDPRVPRREDCVLRYVLERRARLHPDRSYIRLPDNSSISYGEFRTSVERAAAGLAALASSKVITSTSGCQTAYRCCEYGLPSTGLARSTYP